MVGGEDGGGQGQVPGVGWRRESAGVRARGDRGAVLREGVWGGG